MRDLGGHGVRNGPHRPTFLSFDEILANRADAALVDELRETLPDTTDDLDDPWEKATRKR
jgi:hypothetical protein